jgi:hypothetical protein
MADSKRKLLRPEDATSLEEFQARSVVEQAQCRAVNSSWKTIGRVCVSAVALLGAILFWVGVAMSAGPGQVGVLILAVLCTAGFGWGFGGVMRRGARGTRRYLQLDRLRQEWQARAERGEITLTTPGGPKVWQDEPGASRS